MSSQSLECQPLPRDRLECSGVVLLLLDAQQLSMSGGIDTLFHQVPGFEAFFACFCQCEASTFTTCQGVLITLTTGRNGIVTHREGAFLGGVCDTDAEAVTPRFGAVGFDLEIQAFLSVSL